MAMTDNEINQFNLQMRQQPWYQEWFRQRGLNPNMVKLNDQQREELKRLIEQRAGFRFPGDMKVDPAGNLNEKGGWAGLPGWAKAAIIGGGALATGGALGLLGGAAGASGGAAGTAATTATTAGTAAGTTAATTAAAAAPSLMSRIAGALKSPLATVGGRMLGGIAQAGAANRGAEIETRLAHDELALRAARERRDAETDAYRKSLYGQLAMGYQPSARPEGANGRNPEGFITQGARDAGSLMTNIAMQRMRTQDYPGVTPYTALPTRPGTMERIAGYAAPALSLFDPRLYEK